jgi:hypothetical protein
MLAVAVAEFCGLAVNLVAQLAQVVVQVTQVSIMVVMLRLIEVQVAVVQAVHLVLVQELDEVVMVVQAL